MSWINVLYMGTGPTGQTGPTGADSSVTGPTGAFELTGINYGDNIYWNGTTWAVSDTFVAIGGNAGSGQGTNAIAIGYKAGQTGQNIGSVAIGYQSGNVDQDQYSVAIGYLAGQTNQGLDAVAIGLEAGASYQANYAVSIGPYAGQQSQSNGGIAIGYAAGQIGQSTYAIAIGYETGITGQGTSAIAIGRNAGYTNQGPSALAFGSNAGYANQGTGALAIGSDAGSYSQGSGAFAIGSQAGQINQGDSAIAIGSSAGKTDQGIGSIAIGNWSSYTGGAQAAYSIALCASGNGITAANTGFYVTPLRSTGTTTQTGMMFYDDTTNEIQYINASKTFIIDHPTDPTKHLIHATLEGPEAGVYYRGEGIILSDKTHTTILLPDYVHALATGFTVQLTPIYQPNKPIPTYATSKVVNGSFQVHGPPGEFYWQVHASRGPINVEPLKTSVRIKGDGPYKYLA